MATPSYQGPGQPLASSGSGWLGRLGSFFGGATPQYVGEGQPSIATGSLLGGVTPAYKPAPAAELPLDIAENDAPVADACASCPIDPVALAAGQIAIVIPRGRVAFERDEEVAATD